MAAPQNSTPEENCIFVKSPRVASRVVPNTAKTSDSASFPLGKRRAVRQLISMVSTVASVCSTVAVGALA